MKKLHRSTLVATAARKPMDNTGTVAKTSSEEMAVSTPKVGRSVCEIAQALLTERAIKSAAVRGRQITSAFLDLPAEVRDCVYHLCLVEQDGVEITEDYKVPALLSTNQQIRAEAIQIWYLANQFKVFIVDCDASLYCAFVRNLIKPLGCHVDATWLSRFVLQG